MENQSCIRGGIIVELLQGKCMHHQRQHALKPKSMLPKGTRVSACRVCLNLKSHAITRHQGWHKQRPGIPELMAWVHPSCLPLTPYEHSIAEFSLGHPLVDCTIVCGALVDNGGGAAILCLGGPRGCHIAAELENLLLALPGARHALPGGLALGGAGQPVVAVAAYALGGPAGG